VLRCDRGIASNGLEARVPFLTSEFMECYLSVDVNFHMHTNKIEKFLLREAFCEINLLPMNVLYRPKEAFSDGVSTLKRSWFSILQENINQMYSDSDFINKCGKYTHNKPPTKEALYYREIFESYFGTRETVAKVIPYFWLPKWCGETNEPSARVLKHYEQ
jgi:asparagine synthase (glutamine-hydrolysing)